MAGAEVLGSQIHEDPHPAAGGRVGQGSESDSHDLTLRIARRIAPQLPVLSDFWVGAAPWPIIARIGP